MRQRDGTMMLSDMTGGHSRSGGSVCVVTAGAQTHSCAAGVVHVLARRCTCGDADESPETQRCCFVPCCAGKLMASAAAT